MIRDLFFIGVGVVLAVTVPKVYSAGAKFVGWVRRKWADRNLIKVK